MKRGIITLTNDEVIEAFNSIKSNHEFNPLYKKLLSARQETTDTIQLQVNEEEIEVLLDILDIPTTKEPIAKKILRGKLQSFLTELRGRK